MSERSHTQPTTQSYAELQLAFDHFNAELFEGSLPQCLITLQREKKSFGYYSHKRFASLDGLTTDEIALNPSYFAVVPLVETMQTLVHEMTHLWQAHFGNSGRARYHNEEFAQKLESIGLMPSSTGKPGGKRTGDTMADYAIDGGPFLNACERLITNDFRISWFDRFPIPAQVAIGQQSESLQLSPTVGGGSTPLQASPVVASLVVQPGSRDAPPPQRPTRLKFTCPICRDNLWGKPSLNVLCITCNRSFVPVDQTAVSGASPVSETEAED